MESGVRRKTAKAPSVDCSSVGYNFREASMVSKAAFSATRVQIPVAHGELEGELWVPRGRTGRWLVFAHPHPLYGGSYRQPVVVLACRTAAEHGWASLRFNFRGVGASTGSFTGGPGELQDLHEALQWLWGRVQPKAWVVGGYSFGAWVAYRWACRNAGRFSAWLGVAPPNAVYPFDPPPTPFPGWVVYGRQDGFFDVQAWRSRASVWKGRLRICPVEGADHFFAGKESELAAILRRFFTHIPEDKGPAGV